MKNQYFLAVLWFFSHIVIGVINDAITKNLASNLHAFEITFLRFFFSIISLLPFLWKNGLVNLKTKLIKIHLLRGLFLFGAITIWCVCLNCVPIVAVTLISFTIPIFFIILAYFFLKEHISIQRIISTIIGFIGIVILINPIHMNFNPLSLLLIVGAVLFAGLDVINKKVLPQESTLNMMLIDDTQNSLLASPKITGF